MAFEKNYLHPNKSVPWGGSGGEVYIVFIGEDLSTAAFLWAFTAAIGTAPTFSLATAAAGSQGVSAVYDANYVNPETGEVEGGTIVTPQIDEASFEALSWTAPYDDKVFHHNLLVTPSGGAQRVDCYGTLTVSHGVGD